MFAAATLSRFVFFTRYMASSARCSKPSLVRETTWLVPQGLNIRLTPSVGVASYPLDSRTKEGLLHLADEAMYLVKNTKRDSVAAANMGILPNPVASAESAG